MKSKRTNLALSFLLFLMFGLNAQTHIGISGGVNFADLEVNGISQDVLPGIRAYSAPRIGLFVERNFSSNFSLVTELQYSRKGFDIDEGTNVNILGLDIPLGIRAETRMNYVDIPLMAKYAYGNEKVKGYVMAGPSFSYAANGFIQPVASTIIDINLPRINLNFGDDMYNRTQWNGIIGAGVETAAANGKIFMDLRYQHSFSNVLDDPIVDIKLKNKGFSLGIGYAMAF